MRNDDYGTAEKTLINSGLYRNSLPISPVTYGINYRTSEKTKLNFYSARGSKYSENFAKKAKTFKDQLSSFKHEKIYAIKHCESENIANQKGDKYSLDRATLLSQINQVVEEKKKKKVITSEKLKRNNSDHNLQPFSKKIPRNPFRKTEITSLMNKSFDSSEKKKKKDEDNQVHEFMPIALSVKEFSYHEDKNLDNRKSMEDFHKIIDRFNGDNTKGYFSILDGHGGSEPVKYAKDRLPEIFKKFLQETKNNIEKSLIFTFQKIDDELKCYSEIENCGCTVTLVYVTTEQYKQVVYCANVGDTKAILVFSEGECKPITTDHKFTSKEETQRVRDMGGIVFNKRLYGQLALSRALGDFSMKSNGLISTPSIHKHVVTDKDKYLIIASDGVWDVFDNEEIKNICLDERNENNTDIIGEKIVVGAIKKGSRDNISCIVIKLS